MNLGLTEGECDTQCRKISRTDHVMRLIRCTVKTHPIRILGNTIILPVHHHGHPLQEPDVACFKPSTGTEDTDRSSGFPGESSVSFSPRMQLPHNLYVWPQPQMDSSAFAPCILNIRNEQW